MNINFDDISDDIKQTIDINPRNGLAFTVIEVYVYHTGNIIEAIRNILSNDISDDFKQKTDTQLINPY